MIKFFVITAMVFAGTVAYAKQNPHTMTCSVVSRNRDVDRCENKEVVCYVYKGFKKGGLQCQFKLKPSPKLTKEEIQSLRSKR